MVMYFAAFDKFYSGPCRKRQIRNVRINHNFKCARTEGSHSPQQKLSKSIQAPTNKVIDQLRSVAPAYIHSQTDYFGHSDDLAPNAIHSKAPNSCTAQDRLPPAGIFIFVAGALSREKQ